MSGLESLYQELILDHSKRPHGRGIVEGGVTSHQRNPICGDELTLSLQMNADTLSTITWEGQGCSISQASASMLSDLLEGTDRAEASRLIDEFRRVLRSRGESELDIDEFGDAAALSGVSRYTARVKCAMLAWVALEDALARS